MTPTIAASPRPPGAVLAAAFLFNLGQGVLRPTLPLYLQAVFGANYRIVTSIPTVFGAGKWIASLPTGYLLDRVGRRGLMASGLFLIASCDVASATTSSTAVFLGLRGLAGVGWAMFGTVAITAMVGRGATGRRGRAMSLLLASETSGLLLGSAVGGWLYRVAGGASPFLFEAACMLAAATAVTLWVSPPAFGQSAPARAEGGPRLATVLRTPGLLPMGITSAALIAVQTGVLVFLYPLYLADRAGLGPDAVGLLVSVSVLGRLLALALGGGASDRWDRMSVLIPGLVVCAALLALLALVTHPVLLGLWSVAVGGAAGLVAPLPAAEVGDRVPAPHHGVAIGWLRTATDTGQILGPLMLGALADSIDLAAAFVAAAALLLVAGWLCRGHAVKARAVAP